MTDIQYMKTKLTLILTFLFLAFGTWSQNREYWGIKNESTNYPFWLSVIRATDLDLANPVSTESWKAALSNEEDYYILWPGDAYREEWRDDDLIIGAYWRPERGVFLPGFLLREDFNTSPWVSLDLDFWEKVNLQRGETLALAMPQWVDPPIALDGRVQEWDGLPFSLEMGSEGISSIKNIFWGEWLAFYLTLSDQSIKSVFLTLFSLEGERIGVFEFPVLLSQGPVLLWKVDQIRPLRVGSFRSLGGNFEFLIQWNRIQEKLGLRSITELGLRIVKGEAPYEVHDLGSIKLN